MRTRPGTTRSPCSASLTLSAHLLSRRWANIRVNTGGMCWTMTTGTGNVAGSCGSTDVSASGPPVDEPIASTSMRPVGGEAARPASGTERQRGGRRRAAAPGSGGQSALILGTSCVADAGDRLGDAADVGRLADVVVGAERQGVERRAGAALGQRAEHDDRQARVGLAQLAQRAQAVEVGHLDVERDAVGRDLRELVERDAAGRRGADDPISGSSSRTVVTSRRMTTESSTTRTLMRPIRRSPAGGAASGRAGSACRRWPRRVNGFRTYSWAPAASARTIWPCSLSVVTIMSVIARYARFGADGRDELQAVHDRHVPVDRREVGQRTGGDHVEGLLAVARPRRPRSRGRPGCA